MKTEWIIVADTDEFTGCLAYTCGTKERAEEVLKRINTNPDREDRRMIEKGHRNFRMEEVPQDDCWWNQGGLD